MIRADAFRLTLAPVMAAMALTLAGPAAAQDGSADDPRLVTHVYDESNVVTLRGRVKVQATIKFAPDEVIENVAIGDSQSWQVTPNKRANLLFVKPLSERAATNLTVVTSERTYLFDLVSSPNNKPVYVMQFRYPELEKAEEEARLAIKATEAREEANPLEMAAANDPFAVSDPETLNYAWVSEGNEELIPTDIYDNGDATFLTWPNGAAIPAILITNEDGDEGPVNSTPRGDTVIVEGVPSKIILRSGKETATLVNEGPKRPVRSAALDKKQ